MKNQNNPIKVINQTAVISSSSLALLLELDSEAMKLSLADNENSLKQYGNIIIDKSNNSYDVYLNERQTYSFLTNFNEIIKINYIKRKLLSDFFYVQTKLLKKKQRKEIKKHIKVLTSLNDGV
jgi:hypothetical protein